MQFDLVCRQPIAIWMTFGEVRFDLLVVNDPTLFRVDKEHATWSQAALLYDSGGIDIDDPNF
ncbi:unannotated protein [freshwater metagenome]|uniref:Unannotated protein n=1 Tax=freshwater metagenome TaxID=449393 RepID=A0A6J6PVF9_9ZZZZ